MTIDDKGYLYCDCCQHEIVGQFLNGKLIIKTRRHGIKHVATIDINTVFPGYALLKIGMQPVEIKNRRPDRPKAVPQPTKPGGTTAKRAGSPLDIPAGCVGRDVPIKI
jgi:hypothetical protein